MMRLLMTVDAAGGVWRYAMDLASGLRLHGVETAFLGFGPVPGAEARREAEAIGTLDWSDAPLDWMAGSESDLAGLPGIIARHADRRRAQVIQVNVPSQAADIPDGWPILAVHHSCVATWFRAVRGAPLPEEWSWQARLTRRGLSRADAVIAPSRAHAAAVTACFGTPGVRVVANAVATPECNLSGTPYVAASGRWWDEGKDGATLDAAAARMVWPVLMTGPCEAPGTPGFAPRHAVAKGALPHAAATALAHQSAIFVAPSLYEPFGLAVAEAARAARPLVLSDIPTFRELWDGAALFFAPGDAEALAACVNRLAADPALCRTYGRAAQARAARFTVQAQAAEMAALYAGLRAPHPLVRAQ